MPTGTLLINNFDGGINEAGSSTYIPDNEQQYLNNFIPFAGKLIRRFGYRLLNTTGTALENIMGIFGLRTTALSRVIIGGSTSLARLNGTAFTALTNDDGVAIGAGIFLWCFKQYKDIVYGGKIGTSPRRISNSGQNFDVMGIAAPVAANTIADGAAGAIEVGNVYTSYTYYNSVTGAESLPSPSSLVLAHGANLIINWANITVSADPQVNARRLYRTTPGSAANSPKLFVGQLNDNVTLIFADNIPIAFMGDPVKTTENGLPPAAAIFELHNERFFYTDFISLYPSEIGLPESVDPLSVINVAPNDGHLIRGLISFRGQLIIGKTNKMYTLSGVTKDEFALNILSEDFGCYSHHSLKAIEGSLFWFAGHTVCRSDGVNTISIADQRLRDRLQTLYPNLTATAITNTYAVIDPFRTLYILVIGAPAQNTESWAYNYKTGAWTIFTGNLSNYMTDVYDTNQKRSLYASEGGSLFEAFPSDLQDRDEIAFPVGPAIPIVATFRTKRFSPGGPGTLNMVRRVAVLFSHNLSNPTTNLLTLSIYRDGEAAPVKTRNISLAQTGALQRRWVAANLSTLATPGASFAIEAIYQDINNGSGATGAFEIEAIAVEYVTKKQRVRVQ